MCSNDEEINTIKWMLILTDGLYVGTPWVKLICLNGCLVPTLQYPKHPNRSTKMTEDL